MIGLEVFVSLSDNTKRIIKGKIIAFVPKDTSIVPSHTPCNYTVDAMVELLAFDAGRIYQVPMHRITTRNEHGYE